MRSPSPLDDDIAYLSPQHPRLWVGYGLAAFLFLVEFVVGVQSPDLDLPEGPLTVFLIGSAIGWFYWLYCVYKYHDIMTQTPGWDHPIGIGRAIGFHFIPFYNFYWIYNWPKEIARSKLAPSLILMAALLGAAVPRLPAQNTPFDTGAYARVLDQFVTGDGRVRYAALKQDPASLNEFLNQLAAVSPENRPELFPTSEAQIAYWLNAYNAFVLKGVLDGYPVGSVRAFKFGFGLTFFKRAKHWAGGKKYSLDNIEHGILRKRYAEPRIHFAVNCASTSCPVLRNEPFQPEALDQQLDDAAHRFIRQQENVWMRGDVLFLSKIFDWYGEDFIQQLQREGAANPKLADYVARYLPEEEARRVREQSPRVEFYNYDWSLNDASPSKK